ncbi:hypothetical protein BC628DRAFT_588363 [Trametes gibbosa]|nr:hypothetical protein BC628DRAFT_588363 [Trametes gibbosa]
MMQCELHILLVEDSCQPCAKASLSHWQPPTLRIFSSTCSVHLLLRLSLVISAFALYRLQVDSPQALIYHRPMCHTCRVRGMFSIPPEPSHFVPYPRISLRMHRRVQYHSRRFEVHSSSRRSGNFAYIYRQCGINRSTHARLSLGERRRIAFVSPPLSRRTPASRAGDATRSRAELKPAEASVQT